MTPTCRWGQTLLPLLLLIGLGWTERTISHSFLCINFVRSGAWRWKWPSGSSQVRATSSFMEPPFTQDHQQTCQQERFPVHRDRRVCLHRFQSTCRVSWHRVISMLTGLSGTQGWFRAHRGTRRTRLTTAIACMLLLSQQVLRQGTSLESVLWPGTYAFTKGSTWVECRGFIGTLYHRDNPLIYQ